MSMSHICAPHRHISKRRKLRSVGRDAVSRDGLIQIDAKSDERTYDETDWLDSEDEHTEVIPGHPLGLKPLGNIYNSNETNSKCHCGTFGHLPDEILLLFLEYLNVKDLLRLGATCKALHAFSRSEDLWKSYFVESKRRVGEFKWQGSWRATYLGLSVGQSSTVDCSGLFSDALFRPFHCAHAPLEPFTKRIPRKNQITRLPNLTSDKYNAEWADKPFVLTEPVKNWPLYREWSTEKLLERYGDEVFRAEAVDWSFQTYVEYLRNNSDESPLYLFDCRFAEKMGLTLGESSEANGTDKGMVDYTPPECFNPDLFTCLGTARPDHRWLIVGPPRSGSTFHQDPNGTSAWNAVICGGAKYWLMFPPSPAPLPPGIHISSDSSEITAPLSIMEYLLTFHAEARKQTGCIEALCYPGEILHVPAGWYHMVINLEPESVQAGSKDKACIALTQNFVSKHNLPDVLSFLRDKPEQVSGFRSSTSQQGSPYELFVKGLKQQFPDELAHGLTELQWRDELKSRKSKWETITGRSDIKGDDVDGEGGGGEGGSFSFGFGAEGDGEDVDDYGDQE